MPEQPAHDPKADIPVLQQISAEKKATVEKALGGPLVHVPPASRPAAAPPRGLRSARQPAAATPGRERSGIFDAPDARTQGIRDAAVKVRAQFNAIAAAIMAAEHHAPAMLERLSEPGAAETALRLEDFDVAAAKEFLAAAGKLLDAYKPKQ